MFGPSGMRRASDSRAISAPQYYNGHRGAHAGVDSSAPPGHDSRRNHGQLWVWARCIQGIHSDRYGEQLFNLRAPVRVHANVGDVVAPTTIVGLVRTDVTDNPTSLELRLNGARAPPLSPRPMTGMENVNSKHSQ